MFVGRKSLAPSMASFHYHPAVMTGVSVDADDSKAGMQMEEQGENMGDVFEEMKREEIIEKLKAEKAELGKYLEHADIHTNIRRS